MSCAPVSAHGDFGDDEDDERVRLKKGGGVEEEEVAAAVIMRCKKRRGMTRMGSMMGCVSLCCVSV